jgi:hypothetical protein
VGTSSSIITTIYGVSNALDITSSVQSWAKGILINQGLVVRSAGGPGVSNADVVNLSIQSLSPTPNQHSCLCALLQPLHQ